MSDANYAITTDNEFMKAIGLSSFTIPTLYKWVTENGGANLQHIQLGTVIEHQNLKKALETELAKVGWISSKTEEGKCLSAFPIMKILLGYNHKDLDPSSAQYYFTVTKKPRDGRNFVHKKFTWANDENENNWGITITDDDGNAKSYTRNHLQLDDPDLNNQDSSLIPSFEEFYNPQAVDDNTITRIIRMNEIVIAPKYLDAKTDEKIARSRFIQDIKHSKDEGLIWHSPLDKIKFLDFNGDLYDCADAKNIKFRLQLFGGNTPKPNKRFTAANASTVFAVTPKTPTGRLGTVDPSGRPVGAHQKVAGELDVRFTHAKGTLSAGTHQILAVMETSLAAATPPDKGLLEATPEDYLDSNTGFEPTLGKARPITMNAGDVWSWSPNYKNKKGGTDDENDAIETVLVQNKLTNASFASGDMVILNEIEGVWQPILAGSGGEVTEPLASTRVDNWDFMYLVSNADHYFKYGAVNINYQSREDQFHDYYYNGTVGESIKSWENGYVQLTSWDFMGHGVGGLRNKNALGQTQFVKYVNGTAGSPHDPSNKSAPFFGCVFPDGYDLGDKYDLYKVALNNNPMTISGTYASHYMQNIDDGEIIFDPVDNGNAMAFDYQNNSIPSNMFGFIESDPTVHQLPADIALNAHPDSEIGSPLTILKTIESAFSYNQGPPGSTWPQSNVKDFFDDRHAWLADANGDPTFEFTPVNKSHVQFRPLRAEVYAAFEGSLLGVGNRGVFGKKAWEWVNYDESPIASVVLTRAGTGGIIGPLTGLSHEGFQYNVDIAGNGNVPDDDSANPIYYWSEYDWQGLYHYAGGAVGIIGASCTVTANTVIDCTAQCDLGMKNVFVGCLQEPFGCYYHSCYGDLGSLASYSTLNNTLLHARVFHHWPKNQTVYDPRYFAIYHFSAGMGDYDAEPKYYHGTAEIVDGVDAYGDPIDAFDIWDKLEDDQGNSIPIGYPDDRYIVEQITYEETDFRVPTLADDERGTLAAIGSIVWKDVGGATAWRDPDDWKINISARGKLLPVPEGGVVIDTIGITAPVMDSSNPDAGGSGYSNTDTFTTQSGSGSGVELSCTVTNGVIIGFSIINAGTGFLPEDFFNKADTLLFEDATIQITPLSATNGTGLQAYVVNGLIISINKVMEGPHAVGGLFDLSVKSPYPDQVDGVPEKMVHEQKDTQIQIDPEDKSPNNAYDLFLHYHNDISHVFGENWGARGPISKEQAIGLTISPK